MKGPNRVIGKDTVHIYVLFPDRWHPDVSGAIDDALKSNCAEYLTDVEVTLNHWFIPYIYGKTWYEVAGFPWYADSEVRQRCLGAKLADLK
jgi:hypothetical protein